MNSLIKEHIEERGREKGWREGQKEGIQKGREEGIQKVVLNMLAQKADISFVSKMTGLSEEAIRKLKNGS